jgi:hypothetical protein
VCNALTQAQMELPVLHRPHLGAADFTFGTRNDCTLRLHSLPQVTFWASEIGDSKLILVRHNPHAPLSIDSIHFFDSLVATFRWHTSTCFNNKVQFNA